MQFETRNFPQGFAAGFESLGVKAGKLQAWNSAASCIDWSIPCPSIVERKKPLADEILFGKLKDSANSTADSLTRVLSEVHASADALTGAANQAVAVFTRNADGTLEFAQVVRNSQGVSGLNAPASIALSADDAQIYIGSLGYPGLSGGLNIFNNASKTGLMIQRN